MTRSDRAFRRYAEQTEARYGSSPRKKKRRRGQPTPETRTPPKPTPEHEALAKRLLTPSKSPATDPALEKLAAMRRGFRG